MVELEVRYPTHAKGCLAPLIDIVNHDPPHIEQKVGLYYGQFSESYFMFSAAQGKASGGRYGFCGYTYFPGGGSASRRPRRPHLTHGNPFQKRY